VWRAKNVEVNRLLPTHFPELLPDYEQNVVRTHSEEDGPTVIYSLVFIPFLTRSLAADPCDPALIDRLAGFLDMLAAHPEPEYSQVATVEVAEYLADHPEVFERIRSELGASMTKAVDTA
jgi:hypothetical protein